MSTLTHPVRVGGRGSRSVVLGEANYGGLPAMALSLDEVNGTTAADLMALATGTGLAGTYTGTFTLGFSPGPISRESAGALSLGGAGRVVLPASSTLVGAATAATWEAWVRPASMASDQRVAGVFNGTASRFALLLGRTSGRFSVFGRSAAGALVQLDSASTYAASQWHHLAATISGSTLALYVNGASAGSTTADATQTLSCDTRPATLGSDAEGTGALSGQLGRAAFYRYALAADRIRAHYETGINGN